LVRKTKSKIKTRKQATLALNLLKCIRRKNMACKPKTNKKDKKIKK
jgi:hypothetical protein